MKTKFVILLIFSLCYNNAFPQFQNEEFFFLFYNVENLFDTKDNPDTADDEFTPAGFRHWTPKRLNRKLTQLSKVMLAASEWTPPHLIALCEIENRYVLERLLNDTPLINYPYQIIQKNSPDPRGIDVALLYNEEVFYPLHYKYIPIDSMIRTREILYVQGILNNIDTLHLFVNHWPSRYSGLLESRKNRNMAAMTLRRYVESVQELHHEPKIIITGDFNDQPTDESLMIHLKAKPTIDDTPVGNDLYNLSMTWMENDIKTLKHQSQWSVFDQFIVSGSMLNPTNTIYTTPEMATIVKLPFLLEKDEKFGHYKLYRTYTGYRYHGGFSDHLPVSLKLRVNQ